MGCRMAQYRSSETATSEKMEIVHNTTSSDTENKHACNCRGRPTLASIAQGMPISPTSRSATASDTI